MIKIKTKRIKESEIDEYVGVSYKVKNSSLYEHLVAITALCIRTKEMSGLDNDNLLKMIEMNLESEMK